MEALDVEMRIAAGEQALQALLTCARERAGTLEAHEAEQGICKRRLPSGLAAMQRSVAERGTGAVGPAVTRADGAMRPRQTPLRGRDSCSLFGTFQVARACRWRTRGARERPAGRAGQPARAVRLVGLAGVDDMVRGRAPVQGACGMVRAALGPRGGRERADGGGAGGVGRLRGLLGATAVPRRKTSERSSSCVLTARGSPCSRPRRSRSRPRGAPR